jgi:hypothetical protein
MGRILWKTMMYVGWLVTSTDPMKCSWQPSSQAMVTKQFTRNLLSIISSPYAQPLWVFAQLFPPPISNISVEFSNTEGVYFNKQIIAPDCYRCMSLYNCLWSNFPLSLTNKTNKQISQNDFPDSRGNLSTSTNYLWIWNVLVINVDCFCVEETTTSATSVTIELPTTVAMQIKTDAPTTDLMTSSTVTTPTGMHNC